MTKVFLQPGLRGLSGGMGDWVYQLRNGKTILGMKPINNSEPSQAQLAHRERFRLATGYGKFVMSEDAIRPLYEQVAAEKDVPVFALCVADFLNPPSIDSIDARDYTGEIGDPIQIVVSDDFGVTRVDVQLTDDDEGTIIETGQAVEIGSGHWTYTATQAATAGITVQFQVTAMDRPGGTTVERGTKGI